MPAFVVESSEQSLIQGNAPTADTITRELSGVNLGGGNWGAWVGPAPRITREHQTGGCTVVGSAIGVCDVYVTRVQWLYSFPDGDWYTQHGDYMKAQLQASASDAFRRVSSDFQGAALTPFSEPLHGTLASWQSGVAATTPTRDEFPASTPSIDSVSKLLTTLAWVAGIGGAVYIASAVVPAVRDALKPRRRFARGR